MRYENISAAANRSTHCMCSIRGATKYAVHIWAAHLMHRRLLAFCLLWLRLTISLKALMLRAGNFNSNKWAFWDTYSLLFEFYFIWDFPLQIRVYSTPLYCQYLALKKCNWSNISYIFIFFWICFASLSSSKVVQKSPTLIFATVSCSYNSEYCILLCKTLNRQLLKLWRKVNVSLTRSN